MPFLYGNHVVKAHLGKVTEDTPEHAGVVVYSMTDIPLVSLPLAEPGQARPAISLGLTCDLPQPISSMANCNWHCLQGFGVTARSTIDTRKLDPTAVIVFNQAYVRPLSSSPSAVSSSLTPQSPFRVASDVGEYLRDEDTLF